MRALVALVGAVILLAVVQGSYIAIDSHVNPKLEHHLTDDADQQQHHAKHDKKQPAHHHHAANHQSHPSSHNDHLKNIQMTENKMKNEKNSANSLSLDDLEEKIVGLPDCKNNPEKCIRSEGKGMNTILKDYSRVRIKGILYRTLKERKHNYNNGLQEQGHQSQANISGKHQKKDVSANQLHKKDTYPHGYQSKTNGLHLDLMQGDMPLNDQPTRLDDPVRHQRDKRKSRGKRRECLTHTDCEVGDCCLSRHKGYSYCVTTKKPAGARCVDSCTCEEGLECFIAKVNHLGKPRHRNGHHPLLGKCQDPSEPTKLPGYWAHYEPNRMDTSTQTSAATTTQTLPTTSTGRPYTRSSYLNFH